MSTKRIGIEHQKRLLEAAYQRDEDELRRLYRRLKTEESRSNCQRLIRFFIVKRHEVKHGLLEEL